jgi:hypothetical protein
MAKVAVLGGAITLLSLLSTSVFAADGPCDDKLVQSTYDMHSSRDYRLAVLISKDVWEQEHTSQGASGTIYAEPIGEDYDRFKSRAKHDLEELKQNEVDVYNVAWTGIITQNALAAYQSCLQGQASKAEGPHLSVVAADSKRITILVSWINQDVSQTNADWQPFDAFPGLPTIVEQGSHKFSIPRPANRTNLSWNSAHKPSETVTLEPLPPPYVEGASGPLASCKLPGNPQLLFAGGQNIISASFVDAFSVPDATAVDAPGSATFGGVIVSSNRPGMTVFFGYNNGSGVQSNSGAGGGAPNCTTFRFNPAVGGAHPAATIGNYTPGDIAVVEVWQLK